MSSETGHSSSSRRLTLKDVTDAPHASEDSVGMELRAMRLQRGESLSQVSQVLRIRKDMVEAIEHGRHDLLPGHAYEVGFVRAYADYMRLDTADIVRRYKAELASLDEGEHFKIQVAEEDQRFSFVSVSVIVLCLAAAVAGAWYLASEAGWIGEKRPLGPSVAATDDPAVAQPGPATPAPAPLPDPAPAPLPTAPVEPVAPPPPPPRPGGIVAPAPGETATPATGREMGKSNVNARIVLVARRAVLLQLSSSTLRNTTYINRTLQPGDSYRAPDVAGLVLNADDAGAIDVVLDGAFIGRAGQDGAKIENFALSPQAYGAPAQRPGSTPTTEGAAAPAPSPAAPAAPAPSVPAPATPAPAAPAPAAGGAVME